MQHQKNPYREKPAVIRPTRSGASQDAIGSSICPDEVSRMAYFTYVNEGCPEGRQVQHWLDAEAALIQKRNRMQGCPEGRQMQYWLDAEAALIQERNRTQIHGFHDLT